MSSDRRTIRFEDLGEPVQRLIRSLKGGVSDEDMALLEFVSVKDMAKIYGEMSSDRQAEQIWAELRAALEGRRRKAELKRLEMEGRVKELEEARRAAEEEDRRAAEEEEARIAAAAEEEAKRKRKEEKRRRKAAEAAAAAEEEAARLAAEAEAAEAEARAREEEEARLAAEEEERLRREKKKKKREAKLRELEAEQAALRDEQERAKASSKRRAQKDEWQDYVDSHPLEFARNEAQEIVQVKVERETKPPPSATEELLNRSYTPKCPNCAAKFSKPPPEWDCPICLRRLRKRFKVWQPDEDCDNCMLCKASIGRFSRHHCRNCGRLTCGTCLTGRALIEYLGYKDTPVKVCTDCVKNIPEDEKNAAAAAAAAGGAASASPNASPDKQHSA